MLQHVLSGIANAKTLCSRIRAAAGYSPNEHYAAGFTLTETSDRLTLIQRTRRLVLDKDALLYLEKDEKACTVFLMKTNGYMLGTASYGLVIAEALGMMRARLDAVTLLTLRPSGDPLFGLAMRDAVMLKGYVKSPTSGGLTYLASNSDVISATLPLPQLSPHL